MATRDTNLILLAGLLKRRSDWQQAPQINKRAWCRLGAVAPNRQHALFLFFGAGGGKGKRRFRIPGAHYDGGLKRAQDQVYSPQWLNILTLCKKPFTRWPLPFLGDSSLQ